MSTKKVNETVTADASGAFDVPFLGTTTKGRKDPLKINGPDSVKSSRAVKEKNFPKWGGDGGIFIKVKEKCKKFPYCNQGDDNFELLESKMIKEIINEISKEKKIPVDIIKDMLKETPNGNKKNT